MFHELPFYFKGARVIPRFNNGIFSSTPLSKLNRGLVSTVGNGKGGAIVVFGGAIGFTPLLFPAGGFCIPAFLGAVVATSSLVELGTDTPVGLGVEDGCAGTLFEGGMA
jgi:hypothetical protein